MVNLNSAVLHGAIVLIVVIGGLSPIHSVITLAETTIEEYAPTPYMGGVGFHVGEICVSCHTRFSKDRPYANELPYNISKNAVLHIFPCSKPACHNTPPTKFRPSGTRRWDLHLGICDNCHPRWDTSGETIHNTHRNFSYLLINRTNVECVFCHASPQGYNSSIVQVPPWPPEAFEAAETIVKPKWRGNCSFCHYTIEGAERVHDVHRPVLLNACPICHSQFILNSESMYNRIKFPYPFAIKKQPTLEDRLATTVTTNATLFNGDKFNDSQGAVTLPVLSEFYLYFNEILKTLLTFYSLLT